ncbi:helix-turn-helix domain-containing protein [Enterococcus faecalis]|jgi:DNA-binding XRE family transcriptional regulator|uniref:DNA-binding helix-turn-helix protein n=1 Tax=Enterococcus faecalis RP2S-4 TaxID=1244145 RepID=A0ABC9TJ47_ENTFL|nr:helix-turn-helix transcriptional regulator [Enterococcus faecalis]EIM5426221.1 helix-turn-helix transcriptional regulator [Enterococcus faecalis]EIR4038175.1 helix-turn-helix transcriptional regulator [Enterococcus faecalis]EKZ0363059.1 helix-turn-helix transcriptional regulator [Enterococcus faecalis]EPI06402.1 DNA-binding helix-turn-helix protein [Enterococcus faecalis RP2S-4]MCQ4859194.1 helix-turn-helix transcriptional regulator [Enterococcus faecalis]
MTTINQLIEEKKKSSSSFAKEFELESQRLEVAVALAQLRKELGFSQRELAERVGKPQSTIARIENGTVNVSFKVLYEIAQGVGKELHVEFK